MKWSVTILALGACVALAIARPTVFHADPIEAEDHLELDAGALFQQGDPSSWPPQDPYDLSDPLPEATEIRDAIKEGVTFVLDKQSENGSWDVRLRGTLLSMTADEAMDPIAVTSLAALSLQPHASLDARIEPALDRAAEFVAALILRGKLNHSADYAVWRYTLALNFMMQRFDASTDSEKKDLYRATAKRCVNSLLVMQLSNGERPLLDSRRRARVKAGDNGRFPGKTGLVVELPTESDYRSGAKVISVKEGSPADAAGIKTGDRVTGVGSVPVANAVDFYELELDLVQGQAASLKVRTPDGEDQTVSIQIPSNWPVFTGIVPGGDESAPPVVDHFLQRAPAMDKGMEVGDEIIAINGKAITSHADFWAQCDAASVGKNITIKLKRPGASFSSKTVSFKTDHAPAATVDIFGLAEDKTGGDGIVVSPYMIPGQEPGDVKGFYRFPGFTALRLGIEIGDRVTHLNDTPVIGLDHWLQLSKTLPAGRPVTVHWTRGSEQLSGTIVPDVLLAPGYLGVGFAGSSQIIGAGSWEPRVMYVYNPGAAHSAGMQPGDVITKIGSHATPDRYSVYDALLYFTAGDEVDVSVRRGSRTVTLKATLTSVNEAPVEEGGWAYYPSMGESTTHSTTAAMLALYDARDKFGFDLPKTSLGAAERLLENMRVEDPNTPGLFSYLYRSGARLQSMSAGALRYSSEYQGNLGRICICEYTMYRAGKASNTDLKKAVELFVRNRGQLDRVRDFWHTHYHNLWQNAAYYWMYGHHWAMVAAKEVGGTTFTTTNETVLKALMMDRESDGTWLGHTSFGKLCGTTQALWIFGQTEGDHRNP